eukprot:11377304-Alexandrium_andersonii.AAC.1
MSLGRGARRVQRSARNIQPNPKRNHVALCRVPCQCRTPRRARARRMPAILKACFIRKHQSPPPLPQDRVASER